MHWPAEVSPLHDLCGAQLELLTQFYERFVLSQCSQGHLGFELGIEHAPCAGPDDLLMMVSNSGYQKPTLKNPICTYLNCSVVPSHFCAIPLLLGMLTPPTSPLK
jgi:hydrogenase/urease accessory protein HupE